MTQLHLPISLEPNATFNNFYCSNNYTATMVHQLMDTEKPIVLCGKSGSGKTHLLHAICHQTPLRWLYLDCNNHKLTSPDILDNMEEKCVCLDNIHALAHVKKWEDGLFKLNDLPGFGLDLSPELLDAYAVDTVIVKNMKKRN